MYHRQASNTENNIKKALKAIIEFEHDIKLLLMCVKNNFSTHKAYFCNGEEVILGNYTAGFDYYKRIIDLINVAIINSGMDIDEFFKYYVIKHQEGKDGCIPSKRCENGEFEYTLEDAYLHIMCNSVNNPPHNLYEKIQFSKRHGSDSFNADLMLIDNNI